MASDPITILRIKRKRTEEPLEALLLQQQNEEKRLKRSNEDTGVLKVSATALPTIFRLAETVEEASFSNLDEARKLKDRISRRIQPGLSRPQTPTPIEERKEQLMQKQSDVSKKARYRVISQNRAKAMENMPPVVQSSSERAAEDLFQMYEAVRDDETTAKQPKLILDEDTEDVDDIMCNFIPMIKEYLTLNDREQKQEDEDDYVYDVYYRDDQEPNALNVNNVGSLVWFDDTTEYMDDNDTESEMGDVGDEDSNAEDYYQNDYPDEEDDHDDHDEFEEQYGYDLSSDDEDYSL
ncbi:hypothetical protein G6F70_007312 [Rhizopus microsporus]|uniref:Probable RNA polymerase II nuclear localization protein SLC7A6OS n=2 Tax=Rhizopus TaxID=4842 RepID=A0A367JV80_RHIAZ|nr:hypothetical protein G6F71_007061 [Rhizopus microsporus]RCH93836.1 solute carrier 7, member 6 opposite strand [Rhizopus azygosporus]KAG1196606.1 hypothetical protein G6F70_007312 [Rhizopus microsporus]KAG1208330.1 hypothetical protein G6F69_007309 [Rhizopus microsporus]KAG1229671.1 hypothetical protein G6F67_006985 [Rhizopus microsporus]